jgi:hypothetical protein
MFHVTNHRTPRLRRVAVLCTLLLLLVSFALPASAAPPQDLSFTFDVTYAPIPTDQGVGAWSSAGVLAGAGDIAETYVVGGFDNCWTTIHTTSVLTGPTPEDTITVRMQVVRIEAGLPLPPPFPPLCETMTAEGNWTILSATGAYAGLRGQGQATISTVFLPGPGYLELHVHSELQGSGHFH